MGGMQIPPHFFKDNPMDIHTDECPICEHDKWDIIETKIDNGWLIHECQCPQCDSTWNEEWVFFENTNIVDGRISS
jgi:hypothetical protein